MLKQLVSLVILLFVVFSTTYSQIENYIPGDKKYFIGSTLFVPYALIAFPETQYYQLNFGYRIDPQNTVTLEAITWKYAGPLGRQYGPNYENPDSDFPGTVQCIGAGLTYQRFFWKGIYGQVHSTAFRQNYLDKEDEKIQSGFQLFNTFRVGYHVKLFKNRVFIEPSVCATWWPINTNLPKSFQVQEDKFGKIFWGEPGFHFGINF